MYISDKNHAALISQQGEDLKKEAIQLEIQKLRKILLDKKYEIEISNIQFSANHERSSPELYKLALILQNIQSSSAFVERFFSI